MPFKTEHGSHYHMTRGCHGAEISCDTTGLAPCSDCCGTGYDGGTGATVIGAGTRMYSQGYDAQSGTVPVRLSDGGGDARIVPVFDESGNLIGVSLVGNDGTVFQMDDDARHDAEETLRQAAIGAAGGAMAEDSGADDLSALEGAEIALREADRARIASHREDDLRIAGEVTAGGMSPQTAPTMPSGDIQARISALEHELELLRTQAEEETMSAELEWANPYADAERRTQERIDATFGEGFWLGIDTPELRTEHVAEEVARITDEVVGELRYRPGVEDADDDTIAQRIADRIEAEGYGDKLSSDLEKCFGRIARDADTIRAMGVVRERRRRRRQQAQRDWDVAERISAIQDEAMDEMGLGSVPSDKREELAERIEQRIRAEGLDGSLTDGVSKALTSMNAHTAGIAVERTRNGKAATKEGPAPSRGDRRRTARAKSEAAGGATEPAKRPTRRRARKAADPLEGMTPEQEQDAFDHEFSTRTTDAYMGAVGFEGSKSGQHLYGRELSGAVRGDLKRWLGHLGVPRGAVRVASHTYSGGQSLKVEAKIDRTTFGASESEFKAAYRRHFWKMVPDWGTVETSTGPVDVSRLMEPGDNGPLMEDIIDTAWRQYQSGETEVDCGRGGVFGNPRQEIYLNEQGRRVAQRMQRIVDSYNYDDSNGMVDYFSTGFYAYPRIRLS